MGNPFQLLLTVAAGIGLRRLFQLKMGAFAPAVAWFLLYFAGFLLSRVLVFEWYLVPPFPVFEMLAAIGIIRCGEFVAGRLPQSYHLPVTVAIASVAALAPALSLAAVLRRSQRIEDTVRKPIGLWLNANARPDDRILLEPIGYIGYYSHRRIIDVIGLVSPQVLRFYSPSIASPWLAQVRYFKPEWCVFRPEEITDMDRAVRQQGYDWKSEYTLAHTEAFRSKSGETPLVFHVYRRVPRNGPAAPTQ